MPPVPQYIATLMSDLARLEGKVDTFIRQMAESDNRAIGLEGRVRKVENRQHWYSGAGAVVGALTVGLLDMFTGHSHG